MTISAELPDDSLKFYKYVTRATGKIVLTSGSLRWSSPLLFNDCFDNQFDFCVDVDPLEVRRLALQKLWDIYCDRVEISADTKISAAVRALGRKSPTRMGRHEFDNAYEKLIDKDIENGNLSQAKFNQQLRELAGKNKILCLSLTPLSLLMWTYYAEGHRGFVLQFGSAPSRDSPWKAGAKVDYSKNMPRLADAEGLSDVISGIAPFKRRDIISRLVFTKASEFAHEEEWRVFGGSGTNESAQYEDIKFHPLELSGIVVGAKMPENDRSAIAALARSNFPHVKVLAAVPRRREYELDLVPI